MKKNRVREDRRIRAEASQQLKNLIVDYVLLAKEWLTDYGKIFLPIALFILVSATFAISLGARSKVEAAERDAITALEETKTEVVELTEEPFEEDAHPEVNRLIDRYYSALMNADIEVISEIQNVVTNTEVIRLRKMSEYIDHYDNIKVYTKSGPYPDSYVAYVYTDVFLKEQQDSIPGLQSFYVCTGENGECYINNGELTEQEAQYLKDITEQGDVVDLKNRVSVAYNNLMESNSDLNKYWASVSVEIDLSVSEQLALDARLSAQLEEETGAEELEPETETGEEGQVSEEPKIIQVRTTAYVNVRKSASTSADIIGGARLGATYEVIEVMNNGWTKIKYEGGEGYISSQYLEEIESVENYATSGTVTALTTLNVREAPDATSNRIGVLSQGETVDLIERIEGWCKIKFKGQVGYVSSEYVD
ncbi:MAG: SH3 domain-containing protein [Lachnospiraceae bacterium]|nr:SH3 domain-containing protein [Lachnospiraceae bacterium]